MPTISGDIKTLVKKAKKYWWLGMLLGLACHLMPPNYQSACHAIMNACTP